MLQILHNASSAPTISKQNQSHKSDKINKIYTKMDSVKNKFRKNVQKQTLDSDPATTQPSIAKQIEWGA